MRNYGTHYGFGVQRAAVAGLTLQSVSASAAHSVAEYVNVVGDVKAASFYNLKATVAVIYRRIAGTSPSASQIAALEAIAADAAQDAWKPLGETATGTAKTLSIAVSENAEGWVTETATINVYATLTQS